MTYKIEKRIKEIDRNVIVYEFHLLNSFDVSVGVFHDEKFALKVRNLLNGDECV